MSGISGITSTPYLGASSLEETASVSSILSPWVESARYSNEWEPRQQADRRIREFLADTNEKRLNLSGLVLSTLPEQFFEIPGLAEKIQELHLNDNRLTKLPSGIENLTELQLLNLNNNWLKEVPSEIGKLTQLQQLFLSNNQLTELPNEIGELTQLQQLFLSINQLKKLPSWIGKLTQLQELSLAYTGLTELPSEIENLIQLQLLNLANNPLTELPNWIGKLTQLQLLNLANNQLRELPSGIGNLTQLQKLSLVNNRLTELPSEIGKLIQLQLLDLNDNQLTELPSRIENLIQLQGLYLNNNQLRELPSGIGNLTQLQRLYLEGNQLKKLPNEIENLTQLQWLYLDGNQLKKLPSGIGKLIQLQQLYLDGNQLTELPSWIGKLTQLQLLFLNGNQLSGLPNEIEKLIQLQGLYLDDNQLTELPSWIKNLTQLQHLSLEGNWLTELPNTIIELPQNCEVYLEGCPLSAEIRGRLQETTSAQGYQGPTIYYSMPEVSSVEERSLDELLEKLYLTAKKESKDLKQIFEEADADFLENLRTWLSRISWIADYKNGNEEQRCGIARQVTEYLEHASEDELFLNAFKPCLVEASITCGDRVALSLLYIGIHYDLAKIDKQDLAGLARLLTRGVWALELLTSVAENKVKQLRFVDEISIYLGYPVQLKEQLELSIRIENMLYFPPRAITVEELEAAAEFVEGFLNNPDAVHEFLTSQVAWLDALKEKYPEEFDEIAQMEVEEEKRMLKELSKRAL